MTTVINPDGTCYREFQAQADTVFLLGKNTPEENPYPVVPDSSWKVSWITKSGKISALFPLSQEMLDSVKFISNIQSENSPTKAYAIVSIRRDYKTVAELDSAFSFRPDSKWSKLKVKHRLEKKFRWFYTYYKYTETYPKSEIKIKVPIENFMTKDEILYWFRGKPDILKGMNGMEAREYLGEIEDKYNKWFEKNLWEIQFDALLSCYDSIKNCPVTKTELENKKDSLYKHKNQKFPDYDMKEALNTYFKTTSFSALWKNDNSPMTLFENNFMQTNYNLPEETFNYRLILPGKVIQANDAFISGDTLIWRLTAQRLIPDSLVIEAESRRVNLWAFILTALVFIVSIGSFVWKGRK
jgi:hypothetical protein